MNRFLKITIILLLLTQMLTQIVSANTASIKNLAATKTDQEIDWTWTVPASPDYDHTMLYLNSTFITNVSGATNYYNKTGLWQSKTQILSTHTVNTTGIVNTTWVNLSVTTIRIPSITNLQNTTSGNWINWTWTNPTSSDFKLTQIYINSTFTVNISAPDNSYNLTGLSSSITKIIGTHIVNQTNVVNVTWINQTTHTQTLNSITNLQNTTADDWIDWIWTNPTNNDFYGTSIYLNSIFITNVSNTTTDYNLTGLISGTTKTFSTHTFNSIGKINTTWVNQTTTSKNTIPPASITNLQNTVTSHSINWTWTNPSDIDFSKVMIYVNGSFVTNTSGNFILLSGLLANTTKTIGTKTVDTSNNVNSTWVNDTAITSGSNSSYPILNVNTGDTFLTIQEAIDFATTVNGNTIQDDSTSFTSQNIVINKAINLQGINQPTLSASGTGSTIKITVANVTVNGFNITGAGVDPDAGIFVQAESATIINNNIYSNNYYGIRLISSKYTLIENNNIHDMPWYGIILYITQTNNVIRKNNIYNNGWYNIVFYSNSNSNQFYNNAMWGSGHSQDIFQYISTSNTMNTLLQSGVNIINGTLIGGNYYGSTGGYSLTCVDTNVDGICDIQYSTTAGIDYYPLSNTSVPPPSQLYGTTRYMNNNGLYILPGVLVKLNTTVNTTSDGSGLYSIIGITNGTYTVMASKDANYVNTSTMITWNGTSQNLDFILNQTPDIYGIVYYNNSNTILPLKNANVTVDNVLTTHTDANGSYILQNINAGSYNITSFKPCDYIPEGTTVYICNNEFVNKTTQITIANNDYNLDLTMNITDTFINKTFITKAAFVDSFRPTTVMKYYTDNINYLIVRGFVGTQNMSIYLDFGTNITSNISIGLFPYYRYTNVPNIHVYRTTSFDEDTITWNNQPGPIDLIAIQPTTDVAQWNFINITPNSQYLLLSDTSGFDTGFKFASQYNIGDTNPYWILIPQPNQLLQGYVKFTDVDGTNYSLPNATVQLNTTTSTTTDNNGYYNFANITSNTYQIVTLKNLAFNIQTKTVNYNINTGNMTNFTLLFSYPSMTAPSIDGNLFKSTYSHNFKTINLWENPNFVWCYYTLASTSQNQKRVALYEGNNVFACDKLSGSLMYNFRMQYSDIYNWNLPTYHPFFTPPPNRYFETSINYFYSAGNTGSTSGGDNGNTIDQKTNPNKAISSLPQIEREKIMQLNFYDMLLIVIILITFIMTASFFRKDNNDNDNR